MSMTSAAAAGCEGHMHWVLHGRCILHLKQVRRKGLCPSQWKR